MGKLRSGEEGLACVAAVRQSLVHVQISRAPEAMLLSVTWPCFSPQNPLERRGDSSQLTQGLGQGEETPGARGEGESHTVEVPTQLRGSTSWAAPLEQGEQGAAGSAGCTFAMTQAPRLEELPGRPPGAGEQCLPSLCGLRNPEATRKQTFLRGWDCVEFRENSRLLFLGAPGKLAWRRPSRLPEQRGPPDGKGNGNHMLC